MAKIRTLTQLQDSLDAEMAWRIKEVAAFKLVARADGNNRNAFARAGLALVYAHWEGFIKKASEAYLEFVNNQNHVYRDLKTCFAVFGLKGKLALLSESKQAKSNIEALDFVLGEMDMTAKMRISNAIKTESNLTSRVFENIATSLGIDTRAYEIKFNLIDESLVQRRNKVAHGEYFDLDIDDFLKLSEDVLQMMREYKGDLQNAASRKEYRRPNTLVNAES